VLIDSCVKGRQVVVNKYNFFSNAQNSPFTTQLHKHNMSKMISPVRKYPRCYNRGASANLSKPEASTTLEHMSNVDIQRREIEVKACVGHTPYFQKKDNIVSPILLRKIKSSQRGRSLLDEKDDHVAQRSKLKCEGVDPEECTTGNVHTGIGLLIWDQALKAFVFVVLVSMTLSAILFGSNSVSKECG
jgi:hypothetical protein